MTELETYSPLTEALVALLAELRPDLAPGVLTSLVVEVYDRAAPWLLDEEWTRLRVASWPRVASIVRQAARRQPYAQKRAAELEAAKPRPGDYPGRTGRAA